MSFWIQQHFYPGKEENETQNDRGDGVEQTRKISRKMNNKVMSEVPTTEFAGQDDNEDYDDFYMDIITLNNKEYEIKQRRDRLL